MTFDNMTEIVFYTQDFPQNATDTEFLHLLALNGLNAAFRSKRYSKSDSSRLKAMIEKSFTETREREREAWNSEDVAAEYMTEISKTVQRHENPYTALMIACDCIAALVPARKEFGRSIRNILTDVHASALEDIDAAEAVLHRLLGDMQVLAVRIHADPTSDAAHRMSLAYVQMDVKAHALQEMIEKQDKPRGQSAAEWIVQAREKIDNGG